MSERHEQMIIRWFEEVWNQGRRETIDEMLKPECLFHDGSHSTKGPQAFRLFFDRMRADFPEIKVATHQAVSAGDLSCMRWSATMRHATGKQIGTTGMAMVRFEDGRFAEAWQNWDMYGLVQQLEAAPAPHLYVQDANAATERG
ncbi:MAG: SnoaL-like polyketide cyclase [Bryobacterales bacterium]|nr:SnoaL-like polyketide cyclase [Bryobacterales bacterium]